MCISAKEDIKRLKKTSGHYWQKHIEIQRKGDPRIDYSGFRINPNGSPLQEEVIMNNKFKSVPVKSSEITPYSQYISRRDFLKAAGIVTGSALLAACAPSATGTPEGEPANLPSGKKDELGDPANSFEDITNY